jgi:ATP/ADP translocase
MLKDGVGRYNRFAHLAGKFMPMVGLFFLLAFVNTILDSLKDTLVITATGCAEIDNRGFVVKMSSPMAILLAGWL